MATGGPTKQNALPQTELDGCLDILYDVLDQPGAPESLKHLAQLPGIMFMGGRVGEQAARSISRVISNHIPVATANGLQGCPEVMLQHMIDATAWQYEELTAFTNTAYDVVRTLAKTTTGINLLTRLDLGPLIQAALGKPAAGSSHSRPLSNMPSALRLVLLDIVGAAAGAKCIAPILTQVLTSSQLQHDKEQDYDLLFVFSCIESMLTSIDVLTCDGGKKAVAQLAPAVAAILQHYPIAASAAAAPAAETTSRPLSSHTVLKACDIIYLLGRTSALGKSKETAISALVTLAGLEAEPKIAENASHTLANLCGTLDGLKAMATAQQLQQIWTMLNRSSYKPNITKSLVYCFKAGLQHLTIPDFATCIGPLHFSSDSKAVPGICLELPSGCMFPLAASSRGVLSIAPLLPPVHRAAHGLLPPEVTTIDVPLCKLQPLQSSSTTLWRLRHVPEHVVDVLARTRELAPRVHTGLQKMCVKLCMHREAVYVKQVLAFMARATELEQLLLAIRKVAY